MTLCLLSTLSISLSMDVRLIKLSKLIWKSRDKVIWCWRMGQLRWWVSRVSVGVIAQLVERLICIQEAWGSIPHNSIFLYSSYRPYNIDSSKHITSLIDSSSFSSWPARPAPRSPCSTPCSTALTSLIIAILLSTIRYCSFH